MNQAPSLVELYFSFIVGGLLCVGGGSGATAFAQSYWVNTGRLDPTIFVWSVAIAFFAPGPKGGWAAGLGYGLRGFPGAAVALAGMISIASVGAITVSLGMSRIKPIITRLTIPAGFVVGGMIAATAWDTIGPLKLNPMEVGGVLAVAAITGWKNVDPIWTVLSCTGIGLLVWWLH